MMPEIICNTIRYVTDVFYTNYYKKRFNGESPSNNEIDKTGKDATEVLFLCHGNICRSPFAEEYSSAEFDDRVQVRSCGFYNEADRPSPREAVDAAEKFNIDLSTHESKTIDRTSIKESDIIFVMDFRNIYYLLSKYGSVDTNKVYLLGEFDSSTKSSIISDPYGSSTDNFHNTYEEIAHAIDEVNGEICD